ncbi:MAG: hypothetical protein LBM09_00030 [Candidatus Nomurabacteria bacterium]|jgi:hypothetical protein|nr:hypothetical protein [Candidatus Nomurabacteria bacterium]
MGGGSEYEDTINGNSQGGIMSATSVRSRCVKKPDAPNSDFTFFNTSERAIKLGFGKPIVDHQLNRTAINERVAQLKEKYPNEENLNDKAWAMALDENLRRSIGRSGTKFLTDLKVFNSALDTFVSIFDLTPPSYPFTYPMWYALNFVVPVLEGRKNGNYEQIRFSLFPPGSAHYDNAVALNAMTRATTLIKYKK